MHGQLRALTGTTGLKISQHIGRLKKECNARWFAVLLALPARARQTVEESAAAQEKELVFQEQMRALFEESARFQHVDKRLKQARRQRKHPAHKLDGELMDELECGCRRMFDAAAEKVNDLAARCC